MKRSIAVIGGGIAGLGAAAELLRHNCTVTVLEAKDRLGGRIHTVRDHSLPIELGAEFLHGRGKTILNVIRAAGLSTHDVSSRNQVFENGKLRQVDLWGRISRIIHRVDPRRPDESFQDFLGREKPGRRDRRLAIAFVEGFDAARPDSISAHALLRGEIAAEHMENESQSRVNEGYSALIHFLEQDIRAHGGKLMTGRQVKTIRWQPGRVEINSTGGTLPVFDAAVIALPLGVMKAGAVEFCPPLGEKQEAVDGLQFGNVVKLVLVFNKPWWPDFGFVHDFGEKIPTWWTDPRGPMLTGWAGGPKADALSNHSRAELDALALKILSRIFSERSSSLRARLRASHTCDWRKDPLIRGAYSYIPVNGLDLPKRLGAAVKKTLFFAGEATVRDAQTGTVFGAYESGLRAGRELVKACS